MVAVMVGDMEDTIINRDTLNPLKGMSFLQITLPKTTYHFRGAKTLLVASGKLCKITLACAQATTTPDLS